MLCSDCTTFRTRKREISNALDDLSSANERVSDVYNYYFRIAAHNRGIESIVVGRGQCLSWVRLGSGGVLGSSLFCPHQRTISARPVTSEKCQTQTSLAPIPARPNDHAEHGLGEFSRGRILG
jgi:hypothetical protein